MFSFPPFSYPGSFKQVTAAQLHHKDPTAVSTDTTTTTTDNTTTDYMFFFLNQK